MKKLSQINSQLFPPLLSKDEEGKYLKIFCETKDPAARDYLVTHNLRLVAFIARKFILNNKDASYNLDDLISVGSIGLIKAVNSFKLGANVGLNTYASRCIENEILMFLRKTKKHQGVASLESPVKTDESGNSLLISELLSDGSDFAGQVENKLTVEKIKETIEKLKETIDEKEWRAFELRYLKDCKQREIAEELGISRSYVSRLNMKVIQMLKEKILEPKI